jgi:hypothetical protein
MTKYIVLLIKMFILKLNKKKNEKESKSKSSKIKSRHSRKEKKKQFDEQIILNFSFFLFLRRV